MNRLFISILFFSISFCAGAQKVSVEEYIEQYKDIAIREMKRMGVPAAITLAQGILETENGNSELVKKSNNHFGIKCKDSWTGERVYHDDDASGECFRSYTNAEDSYRDHSNYLRGSDRYDFLFKLEATDYRGWAYGIKRAGYATNPRYPEILIKNIEQYNLQQYTLAGINEIPKFEENKEKGLPVEIKDDKVIGSDETFSGADITGRAITINKTKAVFAKKGTSLLAIAIKNNVSLNKLMEFNDLTEEGILSKDQYLYLNRKLKTGDKEFYVVQPGETLYDVGQKNGVQLRFLREYNNLNSDEQISTGTKLFLQPGFSSVNDNNAEQEKIKIHQVTAKEGLYAIARKYKVTVQQLKEWNNLGTDELKIGQEIIVSK
ncbi:MAG: glucosaminidase domain-containing protein [Ferruginibacter sp.]